MLHDKHILHLNTNINLRKLSRPQPQSRFVAGETGTEQIVTFFFYILRITDISPDIFRYLGLCKSQVWCHSVSGVGFTYSLDKKYSCPFILNRLNKSKDYLCLPIPVKWPLSIVNIRQEIQFDNEPANLQSWLMLHRFLNNIVDLWPSMSSLSLITSMVVYKNFQEVGGCSLIGWHQNSRCVYLGFRKFHITTIKHCWYL